MLPMLTNKATGILQVCYNSVPEVLQVCLQGDLRDIIDVFQGYNRGYTGRFQVSGFRLNMGLI